MSASDAKLVSVEPLDSKDAKWLQLVKINYTDPNGAPRTWEAIRRTTKPKDSLVDSIHIIAVLPSSPPNQPTTSESGPHILLEKQFRPPAGKVTVELPAGLVDEGETADEAAVRELREETGYVGTVQADGGGGKRMVIHGSPASSSSTTYMIHMTIDPSLPENQNPVPKLEADEFIEIFWLPVRQLHSELRKLEADGCAIDGKLASFAEGLAVAANWGL